MTIHPVRMNGLVLGVPQTLSYFDKMQERIVRFVEDNSSISKEDFRKLMMKTGELVMDVGTVLDGQGAVECGLIDHLGGLGDAVECLYDMIEKGKKPSKKSKPRQNTAKNHEQKSDDKKQGQKKKQIPVASPRAIAQLHTPQKRRGRPSSKPAAAADSAWINQSEASYSASADKMPHMTAAKGDTIKPRPSGRGKGTGGGGAT
jgi:ClpP class serine protease